MVNSPRLNCSMGIFLYTYVIQRTAEAASATTVVTAEHTMPNPSPPIKIKSKTAFNIEEKAKNLSGVLESPTLLRAADTAL